MKKIYLLNLTLFLAVTVLAANASLAATSEEKVAPESMSLLDRQSWALTMLQRLDQANRVILDPEYVKRQRERFEEMATPFVLGASKEKSREIVRELQDEVEKSERIAIEHLDRKFRQTLTQRLRSQSELNLRQRWFQGWQQTVQAWQKSDETNDRLYLVLDWLQESCDTLEGKSYAIITPVPSFNASVVPSAAEVVEKEEPAPEEKVTPKEKVTEAETPAAPPKPVQPETPTEPAERVASKPKEPVTKEPETKKITPSVPVVEKPKPQTPQPEVMQPEAPPVTDVMPINPSEVPPEIPPGLSVDRTEDRPLPPRRVVRKPVTPPETLPKPKTEPERPPLNINLSELAAQISGNNLALRRLEAKLVTEGRWDAKEIDPFVVQLKRIAIRLEDAKLFYRLLSPSQKKQVDKISDPTAAIKSLRSKVRAARVSTLEKRGPSASLTQEQRIELEHLDRLSDELNAIENLKAAN